MGLTESFVLFPQSVNHGIGDLETQILVTGNRSLEGQDSNRVSGNRSWRRHRRRSSFPKNDSANQAQSDRNCEDGRDHPVQLGSPGRPDFQKQQAPWPEPAPIR
jgi:hypothetical protein